MPPRDIAALATALKNLAARTGEPELSKLVATMVQADRFGTSVAESLRTHSEFMRVKRRQAAEERAAKVGVKLTFPIFFFIMPVAIADIPGTAPITPDGMNLAFSMPPLQARLMPMKVKKTLASMPARPGEGSRATSW